MARQIPLSTLGEILRAEFLEPMGISQYALARAIDVPPRRINEIVKGERAVSADTAVRLGAYFDMDPQFWMNLQTHYATTMAAEKIGPAKLKEMHRHATA
ncbi:HigA family addiction module antitoxin [Cupriavidus pauculus]|uniref:Addiction module antidote protein, HigA family n=1 Tax=Cupriavidus pauculus TaxID=82633 RepID=A0A2N5C8B4_9BURK|nr:HigA family addiction module antitoxin [Cupriavidus pauculus]PLP98455.1 addiction module antidote protein, HigA family [Cupriavidus pauculus]